jgi:hypothetical protein
MLGQANADIIDWSKAGVKILSRSLIVGDRPPEAEHLSQLLQAPRSNRVRSQVENHYNT